MRKIKFEVHDVSHYVSKYQKSNRYQILITIGEFKYQFSNLEKANRFCKRYCRFLENVCYGLTTKITELLDVYLFSLPHINTSQSIIIKEKLTTVINMYDSLFVHSQGLDNSVQINRIYIIIEQLKDVAARIVKTLRKYGRASHSIKKCRIIINDLEIAFKNFHTQHKNYNPTQTNQEVVKVELYNSLKKYA